MPSETILQRDFGALAVGTTLIPLNTENADNLEVAGLVTNSTGTTTITIEPSLDGGATYDSALAITVTNPQPATPQTINVLPWNRVQMKIVQATAAATRVVLGVRKIAST